MTRLVGKVERNCIRGCSTEGSGDRLITQNLPPLRPGRVRRGSANFEGMAFFTDRWRGAVYYFFPFYSVFPVALSGVHSRDTHSSRILYGHERLLQYSTFVCMISTIGDYLVNVPRCPFVHSRVIDPLAPTGFAFFSHKTSKLRKGNPPPELTWFFHPRLPLR